MRRRGKIADAEYSVLSRNDMLLALTLSDDNCALGTMPVSGHQCPLVTGEVAHLCSRLANPESDQSRLAAGVKGLNRSRGKVWPSSVQDSSG